MFFTSKDIHNLACGCCLLFFAVIDFSIEYVGKGLVKSNLIIQNF